MSVQTSPPRLGVRRWYRDGLALLWPLALLPLALLLSYVARGNPAWAEGYVQVLNRFVARPISRLVGILPFSLAEMFFIGLVIGLPILLIVRILRRRYLRAVCGLLGTACLLVSLFAGGWGIAYSRQPLADTAGLTVEVASVEELEGLCRQLYTRANALRENALEDEWGVWSGEFTKRELLGQVQSAFDAASLEYPYLAGKYGNPKPLMLSGWISHFQITGIFIPYTFEANVNMNTRSYMFAATACHEAAHLRGWAREDEANYVAYIVCGNSGIPEFEYSGAMMGLVHAMNALISADSARGYALMQEYSEGIRRDLHDHNTYWAQYEGRASRIQSQVNDAYLKANNQSDGVRSYGRMVDLMLAQYRADRAAMR